MWLQSIDLRHGYTDKLDGVHMKEYDYILFDLDGTLTDSKPGIVKCIAYALEKENIPYTQSILDKWWGRLSEFL